MAYDRDRFPRFRHIEWETDVQIKCLPTIPIPASDCASNVCITCVPQVSRVCVARASQRRLSLEPHAARSLVPLRAFPRHEEAIPRDVFVDECGGWPRPLPSAVGLVNDMCFASFDGVCTPPPPKTKSVDPVLAVICFVYTSCSRQTRTYAVPVCPQN